MLLKFARTIAWLGLVLPAFAQSEYSGPAVLSRGEAPSAMTWPELRFRPFVEVDGVYDTALANVGVNDQGQLGSASSYGLRLSWGVSGTHAWKRTKLGLSYRGSLNHYAAERKYDATDHSFLMGITHRLSRHTLLAFNQSAGIFSRDSGPSGLVQTVPFDPSTTFVPTTDFFDNRTYYLSSQARLIYQTSTRTSYSFGGGFFDTRRRSKALYGARGETASGDMEHRVTRRTTIGGGYTYSHFSFSRLFGGTDLHGVTGTVAVQLSRLLEFSGYGGIMHVESTFLQTVPIDPAIAALLGITAGSRVTNVKALRPTFGARLSRTFRNGVAYAAGGQSVTPGNGLFLTSYATSAGVGYSYTGVRRWSLSVGGNYTRSESISNIVGSYSTVDGGFNASRNLSHSFHLVAGYQARYHFSPDFDRYNRVIHEVKVGIAFAPGDVPLRIW